MPKDQVEIKFGPARFDSPKAVRRAIEESSTTTEENTINTIVNDPNLDLGGGATATQVTVDTYDPATGTGTGFDAAGTSYTFDNGTGAYLASGDTITVIETTDGTDVAIALTDRGGGTTPIGQPIATLSTNFPLRTDNLPFPIAPGGNLTRDDVSYDIAGSLGLGVDSIIGYSNTARNVINAFNRQTASSIGMYATPVSGYRIYIQPSGRVILSTNGVNFYYRNPTDTAWTTVTIFGTGTGLYYQAFDMQTGSFWAVRRVSGSNPVFTRLLNSDSAPVNAGALGTTGLTNTTYTGALIAGHGYLTFLYTGDGVNGYKMLKAAADGTSFTTQTSTFSTANFVIGNATVLTTSGDPMYILANAVTGTTHIRLLSATGLAMDYDTGIPTANNATYGVRMLSSGLVVISLSMRADALGGLSTQWVGVIATTDFFTTAYSYYDLTFTSSTSAANMRLDLPVETETGVIRYNAFSGTSNREYVYELAGF